MDFLGSLDISAINWQLHSVPEVHRYRLIECGLKSTPYRSYRTAEPFDEGSNQAVFFELLPQAHSVEIRAALEGNKHELSLEAFYLVAMKARSQTNDSSPRNDWWLS